MQSFAAIGDEHAPWSARTSPEFGASVSMGGGELAVRDPAGICWEIAHDPGWSVSDDGTVTLEPIED